MRKFFLIITLFTFQVVGLLAQETEPFNGFSSPHAAVLNHLKYLQEESFDPDRAAKSLYAGEFSDQELRKLAIELKQIFDGSGNYVRLEDVPLQADHLDSLTGKNRFILFEQYPDIYLERYGQSWQYSSRTLAEIDKIHKQVYPFGTDRLLNLLPKIGSKKYLGLHLWQFLGAFIIIFLSYAFHKILTFLFRNTTVRILHKYGKIDLANTYILPMARPLSLFIVFVFISLLIPVLQLPPIFGRYVILAINALIPLLATLFLYKLVDVIGAYMQKVAAKSANTLDDQLVPLIRKALKTFIIIIGILAILKGLGTDIWPLLTGLSLGGLAFALAAQDTLKNFFGSLMIFIDRPFQIGDWITSGDIDGTVQEVGFRSTRIRTFRDSVLYVPNSVLSNNSVDNHGLRKYRRFYTRLSVTYDTPAEAIEVFVTGIERIVNEHPETRKDNYNIFLNDYAASSLDIMLYIFFEVPTWNDELRCRQEIMLAINKLAEHLGVRFAFPTQTLHVEELPGQLSLTPRHSNSKKEMTGALNEFFDKQKK